MKSLFNRMLAEWRDITPRNLKYFYNAYFVLLLLRMLLEHDSLLNEVRYFDSFHPVLHFLISKKPSLTVYHTVLNAFYVFTPLCLFRRIRPFALAIVLPCLFFIFTVHESFYSHPESGRYFHARLAVLYPLFIILVCDWIRIIKKRFHRPLGHWDYVAPLFLAQWTLGIVYLGSVMERLIRSGYPGWFDGTTLQTILLERFMAFGGEYNFLIAQHFWVCWALQQVVLFVELGFLCGVIFPSLAPIFVPLALMFHASSEILLKVSYFDFTIILYSSFFHPSFFRSLRRRMFK